MNNSTLTYDSIIHYLLLEVKQFYNSLRGLFFRGLARAIHPVSMYERCNSLRGSVNCSSNVFITFVFGF